MDEDTRKEIEDLLLQQVEIDNRVKSGDVLLATLRGVDFTNHMPVLYNKSYAYWCDYLQERIN